MMTVMKKLLLILVIVGCANNNTEPTEVVDAQCELQDAGLAMKLPNPISDRTVSFNYDLDVTFPDAGVDFGVKSSTNDEGCVLED